MSCLFCFDVLVICLLFFQNRTPNSLVLAKSRNTTTDYKKNESFPVSSNLSRVTVLPISKHESWFPFIVAIERWLMTSGEWFHSCSGSIISADAVLTSCQCIGKEAAGNRMNYYLENWFRVIAGRPNPRLPSPYAQTARVKGFKAHPSCLYPHTFLNADVGFVFLQKPFVFNLAVKPSMFFSHDVRESYATLTEHIDEELMCYSPGWGSTYHTLGGSAATFSIHPALTTVHIVSEEQCKISFCSLHSDKCERNFSESNQVCALAFPNSPSCFSDIGGPLICNRFVVGVASWTVDSCITHSPIVFSDIRAILDALKFHGYEKAATAQGNGDNLSSSHEYPSSISSILLVLWSTILIY